MNKKYIFIDFLYPLFLSLLLGVAGYFFSGNNLGVGFFCVIIGFFFHDFVKRAEVIKQKDKEIDRLNFICNTMRDFFENKKLGQQSVILEQVRQLLKD